MKDNGVVAKAEATEIGKASIRRRLVVRLIIAIALFSSAITLVASGIQLYGEYNNDVDSVRLRMSQAEETSLASIVENTWLLDQERLVILMDGLTGLPDFIHAEVVNPNGDVLAESGSKTASRTITNSVLLTYIRRDKPINIGSFNITMSLDGAVGRTIQRAGMIFLSNGVNVALVAIFIYFMVHRLITRHMESMARYARSLSLDALGEPLRLDRAEKANGGDELADMVGAINEMRDGLQASYASLRDLNESLEMRVADRTAELTKEIMTRNKAEQDLREALDLNEKIAGKSPIGILVISEEGDFISVNKSAGKIVGGSPEEMVQLNYQKLESWRESGLRAMADKAFSDNQPQHDENVSIFTSFGADRILDCHLVPFRAGGVNRVMMMFSDVSDSRRAEISLRSSEQRFRDYAEAASQWFWETDATHNYTEIHGAGPELIGIDRDRIVGTARWELASEQDMARDPAAWAKNRDDMENHRLFRGFEYAITAPDGRVAYVSVNGKPVFSDDGRFVGYRGTGQDITARREIEVQLIHASKMATLGEMATGVAHELNQPLNVIRLAAANIERKTRRGTLNNDYLIEKIEKMNQNVDRAAAIINHMRIFGRKEVGVERVDPRAVVKDAAGMIGEQLRMAGIKLSLVLPDECPSVKANPVQFEQVVLNLLSNARDALLENQVADKKVIVEVSPCGAGAKCESAACDQIDCAGNAVAIFVRDTAGGIPDSVIDRIFEPFFTTKAPGQGTGLGLSISFGLVKDMGGSLQVNNVNGGAEFAILLPLPDSSDT